mgnify:FL=1
MIWWNWESIFNLSLIVDWKWRKSNSKKKRSFKIITLLYANKIHNLSKKFNMLKTNLHSWKKWTHNTKHKLSISVLKHQWTKRVDHKICQLCSSKHHFSVIKAWKKIKIILKNINIKSKSYNKSSNKNKKNLKSSQISIKISKRSNNILIQYIVNFNNSKLHKKHRKNKNNKIVN